MWERWAEEKGAHVLTAAVWAGAGRQSSDRQTDAGADAVRER